MKRKFLGIVLLFAAMGCLVSPVFAEDEVVVLRSGEVLRGTVIKEGASYKVSSEILGNVTVREIDVVSVREVKSAQDEWRAQQEKFQSDPAAMASIRGLAQNKEIVDLVMDPELQDAIKRRDVEAMKSNPKFIQLAQNPEIRRIIQQSMSQQEQ